MCRVSAGGISRQSHRPIQYLQETHHCRRRLSQGNTPIAADQSRRIISLSARSCLPSEWPMKNFSCTANLMKKVLSGLRCWFMAVHTRLFAFAKRSTDKCLHIECHKNFSVCCDAWIYLRFTGVELKFAGRTNCRIMISMSNVSKWMQMRREVQFWSAICWPVSHIWCAGCITNACVLHPWYRFGYHRWSWSLSQTFMYNSLLLGNG